MVLTDTLPCGSCLSRVEIGTMRYNLRGIKLVCERCYEKEQGTPKHP
ncbi:hypothetical protein HYY73_04860 [Candidatus Woesearchaeota archaeon]|nr:hypothetical protein [Candidatus Woesearchaeota archaeon]